MAKPTNPSGKIQEGNMASMKTISLLIVFALGALLISSCGGPAPAPTTTPSPTLTPSPSPSPSPTLTPSPSPSPSPTPTLSPSPTPPPPKEGIYLDPALLEAKPGQEFTIRIQIKPTGWGVSGGEISLSFDPAALEVVELKPGDLLGLSPLVGLKKIDHQAGLIRYALARVGPTPVPTPPGAFAVVRFRVLEKASLGTYELKLTKVGLADENFQDVKDFKIYGALVRIG